MRDIPAFTTENGVAGLVLSQIPYSQNAFVRIYDGTDEERFIKECVDFCKAAGAQRVYGTNLKCTENLALFTSVCRMSAECGKIGETDDCIFPVTENTLERWRTLYNEKVTTVPAGAYMTIQMANEMLRDGDCYFVHRDGELQGIGKASGGTIHWISSHKPGAGPNVVKALCKAINEDTVNVEVSMSNSKAVRLYESLGFVVNAHLTDWYCLTK